MSNGLVQHHRLLEMLLVAAVMGISALAWSSTAEKSVLLHLYYLPVVLAGFYLGRYCAGLLSLLAVLGTVIPCASSFNQAQYDQSTLVTLLAFSLWAAALGLTSVVVGTLGDAWRRGFKDLSLSHEADVLTDPLTGVANRRAFDFELTMRLADWRRHQTPVALLLIDIDCFKTFNDRYGHQAGDAVLRDIAQLLQRVMRETDVVARYGGEEFGVVVPSVGIDHAKEAAERARSLIESTQFHYDGLVLWSTVSVGVAHVLAGDDATSLIQRADAALYSSKDAGRNCAHFHDGLSCMRFGNGMAISLPTTLKSEVTSERATDEVTGLPTQAVFLAELRRRAAETQRYGTDLSVALVGVVDMAKSSCHDERARKHLLITVARLTCSITREMELIARYDEGRFIILLPSTDLNGTLTPMQRLSESAASRSDSQYASLSFAVNIGVAQLEPGEHSGSILQRVESALTTAESTESQTICVHDGMACQLVKSQALIAC